MIRPQLSEAQFDRMHQHIHEQGIELVVSDFNGVLDDYYGTKYGFLSSILGNEHRDQHFARLAQMTDTAYIQDRSATLESTIANYYDSNGIKMSGESKELLEAGPSKPTITPEARRFLATLAVPTVIFTAQQPERLYQSVEREFIEDLQIGVVTSVAKPSVEALARVLSDRRVPAVDACMIGDGLIDDILPAKLLSMKTVLVSPFADTHVSE